MVFLIHESARKGLWKYRPTEKRTKDFKQEVQDEQSKKPVSTGRLASRPENS